MATVRVRIMISIRFKDRVRVGLVLGQVKWKEFVTWLLIMYPFPKIQ